MPTSFPNTFLRLAFVLILIATSVGAQTTAITPKYRYLADAAALSAGETVTGLSRVLDLKGRNPTSPSRS